MSARTVLLALFFLSGLCSLIYQLLWARWLGLFLGNFATAAATVIAIFMLGLALGNAWFGRTAARLNPQRALILYALLEAGLAGLAALSPWMLSTSSALYPALAASSSLPLVRALLCVPLLLPPTVLMGGTLPAIVQALSATTPRALGPLYALNMVGAGCGPLLAAFILMPKVGLTNTLMLTCALNIAVAAVAFALAQRWPARETVEPAQGGGEAAVHPGQTPLVPEAATSPVSASPRPRPGLAYALGFLCGFLALAFEIALTHHLVLTITGSSIYGLTIILSTFLFGLALGAALVRRWPPPDAGHALLAVAAILGIVYLFALTTPFWDVLPLMLVRLWATWQTFWFRTLLNFFTVGLLLLPLTTAFGYALPALAAMLPARSVGSIGRLFAANTLGAVLGATLTGFLLLRTVGLNHTLLSMGTLALLAAAGAAILARPRFTSRVAVALPLLLVLPFVLPHPDQIIMNAGFYNRPRGALKQAKTARLTPREWAHRSTIIYQQDSYTGRIVVRQRSPQSIAFIVNGKPDGSTHPVDLLTQIGSAHLAALLHPHPRRVLLVGLGTGISAGSLALHPEIEELHVVEIDPAVAEVAKRFNNHNDNVMENPKVALHVDDARHLLLTSPMTYDLVFSEPTNLFVSGMVNLFTSEFYRQAKRRLNPGGVFLQFIHYYQMHPQDLQGALRTFHQVFPHGTYWMNEYGDSFMVATDHPLVIDAEAWERRGANRSIMRDLGRIKIYHPLGLLHFYRWGPEALARYTKDARICTDDFPYLEFTVPFTPHGGQATRRHRATLQAFPVRHPVPLAKETTERRLQLAEMFFSRNELSRARLEYQRALILDPASPRARQRLDAMRKR